MTLTKNLCVKQRNLISLFFFFLDDLEDERERMFLQISEYCLPKLGTIHILRKHFKGGGGSKIENFNLLLVLHLHLNKYIGERGQKTAICIFCYYIFDQIEGRGSKKSENVLT